MSMPRKILCPLFIKLWPIIGLFLFSTLLFAGCGQTQKAAQSPAAAAPATSTPILPTPTLAKPVPTPEATTVSPTVQNSVQDNLPQPDLKAKIGKITFAPEATNLHEPVNPSLLFSQGITQVHAIFDYSDMSPSYTWERVWLLNDKEVGRKSGPWTGPASGVFDYSIDNSGKPLPPGDWVLEIYVEGKLLSLGAFVIEAAGEAGAPSSAQ